MCCIGYCVGCFVGCGCKSAQACCSLDCGRASKSKVVRAPYLLLFFISVVLSVILRYWGGDLVKTLTVANLCVEGNAECQGNQGVYRLSFASFVFFLLHAIILLFSKTSNFHYENFLIKIIYFVGLIVVSFLVPDGFFEGYANFARVVSGLFILLQIRLLIEFAYNWNKKWLEKDMIKPMLGATACLFILAIVGWVLSFSLYGDCNLNEAMILLIIIISIVLSIMSVSSKFVHGSLLPSAIVCAYMSFLLYSALRHSDCNTDTTGGEGQLIIGLIITSASITYSGFSTSRNLIKSQNIQESKNAQLDEELDELAKMHDDDEPVDELHTIEDPKPKKKNEVSDENKALKGEDGKKAKNAEEESDQTDEEAATYRKENITFHWIMAAASLYCAMLLTNWGSSDLTSDKTGSPVSKASYWIKMGTCGLTALLYLWTLTAPVIFPGREFDF